MAKDKKNHAVTVAAREAANQMTTWSAVETMAKKAMSESEKHAGQSDFGEFLLSGEGSRAIIRIGGTLFRVES